MKIVFIKMCFVKILTLYNNFKIRYIYNNLTFKIVHIYISYYKYLLHIIRVY